MGESPRRPAFCWQSKDALKRIREAFDAQNCVSSALSVYMALTELASNTGSDQFTASHASIAFLSGVSVRSVFERLSGLEKVGLIEVRRGDLKTPNSYRLLCRVVPDMQPLQSGMQPLQSVLQPSGGDFVADVQRKGKNLERKGEGEPPLPKPRKFISEYKVQIDSLAREMAQLKDRGHDGDRWTDAKLQSEWRALKARKVELEKEMQAA